MFFQMIKAAAANGFSWLAANCKLHHPLPSRSAHGTRASSQTVLQLLGQGAALALAGRGNRIAKHPRRPRPARLISSQLEPPADCAGPVCRLWGWVAGAFLEALGSTAPAARPATARKVVEINGLEAAVAFIRSEGREHGADSYSAVCTAPWSDGGGDGHGKGLQRPTGATPRESPGPWRRQRHLDQPPPARSTPQDLAVRVVGQPPRSRAA